MSKNLIHDMFGQSESEEEKEIVKAKEKRVEKQDDIEKINVGKREFYDKLDSRSSRKMLINDLNNIFLDDSLVRSKIIKRKFLLTKNLNFKAKKPPKSKNYIGKRLIKKKNMFDFKNEKFEFKKLLPLKNKWETYILDVIANDSDRSVILNKIMKSDFHGSLVEIVKSKIDNQVGKKGIVLKDTKNAFTIVDTENKVCVILKSNCIFKFFINTKEFVIYGPCLINRVEERSRAKFNFDHMYNEVSDLIDIFN